MFHVKSNHAINKKRLKYVSIFTILILLLLLSLLISMNTGFSRLSPLDTIRTLLGGGSARENTILFTFRLPRIIISMLIGAGLSLAGCIIQGVTKNPLADPGLLGINAGAGLMVVIYILFIPANSFLSIFTLPFLSLIGASGAAIIIYLLATKKGEGVTPIRLILTGVAIQAGISALMTLLVIKMDDSQFTFVATWQAGSIWGTNWKFVQTLLPWLLFLIPYVYRKAKVIDVLNLGDGLACGLGVSIAKERRKLLFAAVALAASCVSISGNISFVGLLAPHVARRLVGPRHHILIPACIMIGAVLVSISDTVARVILQPTDIPTGIAVAVIGAPYFLYLLSKTKS